MIAVGNKNQTAVEKKERTNACYKSVCIRDNSRLSLTLFFLALSIDFASVLTHCFSAHNNENTRFSVDESIEIRLIEIDFNKLIAVSVNFTSIQSDSRFLSHQFESNETIEMEFCDPNYRYLFLISE